MTSGRITSLQIDGEMMETVTDFIFLGSKITADGECSHEMKRHLLLGGKILTNLYRNSVRLYFWGLQNTADGKCSHEMKRHLLLGGKVLTNLDSIFKRRDITLPAKVHLVKALVFPMVMYGCESWTIKKAECQ